MGLCNACQDMLARDEREEALCQHEARQARRARLRNLRACSGVSLDWRVKLRESGDTYLGAQLIAESHYIAHASSLVLNADFPASNHARGNPREDFRNNETVCKRN
jgi:hypothetical protein